MFISQLTSGASSNLLLCSKGFNAGLVLLPPLLFEEPIRGEEPRRSGVGKENFSGGGGGAKTW